MAPFLHYPFLIVMMQARWFASKCSPLYYLKGSAMDLEQWMTKRAVSLIVCTVFLLVMTVFTQESEAIPAFTRKYQTSCMTCHEAFPRLNATGEAFRLNGYKFDDEEAYIKDEPVELGDDAYKKVWPNAVWPSDIPGQPPIAVLLKNQATVDTGGTGDSRVDFNFPNQGKLLFAGSLGDEMSAFVELGLSRGGGGGHGSASADAGTETELEGWVQFEDLFDRDNTFNIRVGTVGMQEMGLFTARNHNRISVNSYQYSSWSMPSLDHDALANYFGVETDLEGNPFVIHAQPGIEFNGFDRSWRYAVGVVNGNGEKVDDNNSQKDVYLQLAYKIGGMGFDGSGLDDQESLGSAESWRDDSMTLSFFAYNGTFPVFANDEMQNDRFLRLGPGLLWRTGDLQFGTGYIFGKNNRPFGTASDSSVDSRSWFVESTYFAKPWLIPYVRYESLSMDLPSDQVVKESFPNGADQNRVIVGTKMLLRANVSMSVEGRFYSKNELRNETNDGDQLVFELTTAF